ncbi:MAG: hypothetical protein JW861_12935 [Bacteroidales bacterium]|nr:hypothetical protein [Bacteroidales bacterium]
MTVLTYTYECRVDEKGRVLVPGGLKKELAEVLHEGFVIKRSIFRECLELYPLREWEKEVSVVNRLNRFVRKNVEFIRKFMAGVKPLELDGSGRILIPRDLMAFAGIERDIVLTSQINKIEIWNKEKYESVVGDKEVDFAALAEDVMGGINSGDE